METNLTYKIARVVNDTIKTIHVFIGKAQLEGKYKKYKKDAILKDVFTPEEIAEIRENNIAVKFLPERLYNDDTIEIIKKKILLHTIEDYNVAFDEIYLFFKQNESFNITALYQAITQNEKLDLTRERLIQFLLNIDDIDIGDSLHDKPLYSYADLVKLNTELKLDQHSFLVAKPLGQKMVSLNAAYQYTVNPFNAEVYDTFLVKFADEITTTTNKNILMQYGNIFNNTIYLCLAEEVLQKVNDNSNSNSNLSENSTIKIYYPYLYGKEITTLQQLQDKKQRLLTETRLLLTDNFDKNNENINLFYDVYANRKEELKFLEVGIKSIILIIKPDYVFNLPLDIVFKLIHATQDIPLIKLNPAKKKENIYRLYTDKISKNGKKIPYLDKGAIFKWDKVIGRTQSVAVYIEHFDEVSNAVVPIICEFENNGNITIKANFNSVMKLDEINELFIKEVNPIINIIKEYLAQNGYNMNNFTEIKAANVEIVNIDYVLNIEIQNQIKLKAIIGCVSSVFNVINDNLDKGIMLRFKRVTNYNEMESQEALIVDMSNPQLGYSDMDIIKTLQGNFNLSEEAARTKYVEVKRAQEVMQTANRRIKVINNPGFLTKINKQLHSNVIMINVSGINHIGYLDTLYIYIDSLMRITQNQASTRIAKSAIASICRGKKIEEEKEQQIVDIIAPTEQMNIVAEELVFNKPNEEELEEEETEEINEEDEAALLARFGYEEEEEEEGEEGEEEEGGGRPAKVKVKVKGSIDEDTDDKDIGEEGVEGDFPLDEGVEGDFPLEEGVEGDFPLDEGGEGDFPLDEGEYPPEKLQTDVTGQILSSPNPFSKRIYKRDKNLFYTEDGKKNFKAYSRTCAWNYRRQPVILNDEEKTRIDKEHPGSYEQALHYGSNPDKKFWYICPRYWDLKNNTSLRADEINPKEVIAKKDKKVPAGKHVFEFNDQGKEHLDEKKNYITHYPGFLKPDDKGKCLPCCFKSWDSRDLASRRAQCTKDETVVVPEGRKKKKTEEIDEYILSHDKFPIMQENRFGYLPLPIQKFLHTDNKKCQISELNTNIKQKHPCLLRHSVEINQTQSFIACIADIWWGISLKTKVRPTIKQMKAILIDALDVDRFVSLQNGNLIQLFIRGVNPPDPPFGEEFFGLT